MRRKEFVPSGSHGISCRKTLPWTEAGWKAGYPLGRLFCLGCLRHRRSTLTVASKHGLYHRNLRTNERQMKFRMTTFTDCVLRISLYEFSTLIQGHYFFVKPLSDFRTSSLRFY